MKTPGPKYRISGPKKGPKKKQKSLCHSLESFPQGNNDSGSKIQDSGTKQWTKKETKIALSFLIELSFKEIKTPGPKSSQSKSDQVRAGQFRSDQIMVVTI